MRFTTFAAAALAGAFISAPAAADVTQQDERGFVTRDVAVVEATPKEVWLALITPSTWWNSAHTWSGDSANLMLRPQAGGCFCERIPEAEDGDSITLEGSVEHMRVIQSYPERAMRLTGALGPLQSEAVTGVLTIAISQVDEGTLIVWEYSVGGRMRYEIPVISKSVDGVMSQQLAGLANLLGRVGAPPSADEPEAEEPSSVDEAFDGLSEGR
ncbi:SRPBCC family protein [Erythrobacter sp.]|nr:SRPBCC family protein [Erythrobacter sp.]